jgi:uncharacterized protein YwqG
MDRDLAEAYIRDAYPDHHQAMLLRLLEPSIRITSASHPYGGANLRSKFGGDPAIPDDIDWPAWDARAWTDSKIAFFERRLKFGQGTQWAQDSIAKLKNEYPKEPIPLSFIAQIDLEEADPSPHLGLPTSGRLFFFYDAVNSPWGFDPSTRTAAQVLYLSQPISQIRRAPRSDAPPTIFKTASLRFEPDWTLPEFIEGESPELSIYKLDEKYRDLITQLIGENTIVHRIRGHDQPIQNDMKLEAQLVSNGIYCGDSSSAEDPRVESLSAGAADWVLLLQVDSDEAGPGWMWGDAGRLYYWIRKQDLADRDFSQIWATEQCY